MAADLDEPDPVAAQLGEHVALDVGPGGTELVSGHGGDDHQVGQVEVAAGRVGEPAQ